MNALQLTNLKKTLAHKSRGHRTEYNALVKGDYAVIIPASQPDRFKSYISKGYVLVMNALDGDVMELY